MPFNHMVYSYCSVWNDYVPSVLIEINLQGTEEVES